MKFFGNIRLKIGQKRLNRKLQTTQREKKVCNLSLAKNIGILFSSDNEFDWQENKQFIDYLIAKNIKVTILAYVINKKLVDYYNRLSMVNYFSDKDLQLCFIPKPDFIKDFIDSKFDILIDLSLTYSFPINYIIALSKSSFKVGIKNNLNSHYDLMIDLGNFKNKNLYFEELKHYLTIINNN